MVDPFQNETVSIYVIQNSHAHKMGRALSRHQFYRMRSNTRQEAAVRPMMRPLAPSLNQGRSTMSELKPPMSHGVPHGLSFDAPRRFSLES